VALGGAVKNPVVFVCQYLLHVFFLFFSTTIKEADGYEENFTVSFCPDTVYSTAIRHRVESIGEYRFRDMVDEKL